ncbi:MAG: M15 family metallopeptidase [Actinomycetota bacterium]
MIVASHVGRHVHLGPEDALVIGARPGVSIDALEKALEKRLSGTGALLKPLIPESPMSLEPAAIPQQVGTAEGDLIGRMSFRILRNGFIEPDREWVQASIAIAEVPILGSVTCHRLLLPQLHAALSEVQRRGLSELINPRDYGGCYVPRFIDRDPSRALSMHAFGLAVDLNVSSNQLGTKGNMDPRVVEVFERWGFVWGGRWSTPDPMHLELARLIQL